MPKFAANLTMMFNEVEFMDRFEEASRTGFDAVEFLFPYDHPKELIAETLSSNRLKTVLFNFPAGDWESGERGLACIPNRVGEFQDGVGIATDYANAIGCGQLNCLSGIVPPGVDIVEARETFISNLKFAASHLSESNVKVLIEPINTKDIPGMFLTSTRQALSIIDDVGSDNLGLQYDVYHMQIMEGDLVETITYNKNFIKHIQIADNPGRNEPGTGEINYEFVLGNIDGIGYEGWVGCEYKPRTTTKAGLSWMKQFQSEV